MRQRANIIRTLVYDPEASSWPRDLFHLHDDEQFRVTYDTLWDALEAEVRTAAETWRRAQG